MSTLREEIDSKQTMIEELRDANQKLTLAQEKMIGDYDKLKKEEEEKSVKLADIAVANERREQAKQDLCKALLDISSKCTSLNVSSEQEDTLLLAISEYDRALRWVGFVLCHIA